jgi:hypothetical protein
MSPEDAEEWTQALAQVGAGWWRQVALAIKQGVPETLGLVPDEWRDVRLGGLVLKSIPERKQAVAELTADGFTRAEIAATLGVDERTVQRDRNPRREEEGTLVSPRPTFPLEVESTEPEEETLVSPSNTVDDDSADDDALDEYDDVVASPTHSPLSVKLEPAEPGWHELGEHRLYCGSSTDEEFVAACQGAFAFADPPYNASKADWDQGFEWGHDYLSDVADIVAVTPGLAAMAGFLAQTEMPYRWSIAAEITNGMTAGALRFGNWICVNLFAHGSIYRKSKDHVRIPAATGDDSGGSHPSRKPIRLLIHLIELFTTRGDAVIDPFLGSGTTLLAAERTGRRCIGAEIDPMYCAEIIARYNAEVGT